MKKNKLRRESRILSFAVLIILIVLVAVVSCENNFVNSILPSRVPKKTDVPVVPVQPQDEAYTVVVDIRGCETDDTVTASPATGGEGVTVTLTYTVSDTAHYNLLEFGGVTAAIASVSGAGSGTRTYVIDPRDASSGVITITAVFEHTDLVIDPIAFTDAEGHITKTYGDTFTNAITAGYAGSGAIAYSSSDTAVATVDDSGRVTIHKVGSAVITAEKAADAKYAHAQANYTLTVNPKPVTVTGLSAENKVYDGTTVATVTGTAVINGLVGGDAVTVTAGTATFADGNAGTGKTVIFGGYSLGGADAGNYTLPVQPANVAVNITARPVTIIGLSADDKFYDGTTAATVTGTAVIDGLVDGDTVTIVVGTAEFEDAGIGDKKTVTFSGWSLDGADAGNYVLSAQPASVTAVITNKEMDPIAFANTDGHIIKTYGDAAFTNAVTGAHKGSGAITYSSSDTTVAMVNGFGQVAILKAGSTVIKAEKAADEVYAHAQTSYTLTVNPKPVTITGLSANNKVYDGTTAATVTGTAALNGVVGGDTVTVSDGTAMFTNKNAGTGKTVTFSGYSLAGADTDNYNLSAQPANVTANITAKPVTIIGLSAANKMYDGTTAAAAGGTAALNGVVGGDTVTISFGTAVFANKDVGTGKTVTFSGYSLAGADAGNYSLSAQPASVTANITAKSVTITGLSAADKTYDGTTTATVTGTAVISGKISTDTVTINAGKAVFASSAAGNGKTVTFSGWSLGGADAGNYKLSAQPASVTANITKATGAAVGKPSEDGSPSTNLVAVFGVDLQTPTGQSKEYAISTKSDGTGLSAWQSGVIFTGLTAGTTYYVYARSAENANYTAGPMSVSNGITTASITFTVTFNSNGGSSVSSKTITAGAVASRPTNPTRSSYTFDYWYQDSALTIPYYFNTPVTASITLYAKWVANTDITTMSGKNMVWIAGGTFIMGSPTSEPNRSSSETQHPVTLSGFYMGKYQVTQKQYQTVMGTGEDRTTATYGKGDNYPIYYVNWYDALVFCNKLSVMEGLSPVYSIGGSTDPAVWIANNGGSIPTSSNTTWNAAVMDKSKNGYRLPMEAEWEYACRGSYTNKDTETNTKPFGIGDGTKITSSMANFNGRYPYDFAQSGQYNDASGTYLGRTTTVGSYTANNYGLYDMHGNLFEWCWDWYKADITADNTNPTGAVTGANRVERGGGWGDYGRYLRSAYRNNGDPFSRSGHVGFRLVRS